MKIYKFNTQKQIVSVLARNKKSAIALAKKSDVSVDAKTPCTFERVQLPQF